MHFHALPAMKEYTPTLSKPGEEPPEHLPPTKMGPRRGP